MSYLLEVLSSAEQVEVEDIKKKIPVLISEAHAAQHELKKYVDNVYVKFTENPMRPKNLFDRAQSLAKELNEMKVSVEKFAQKELCASAKELDNSVELLKQTDDMFGFVTKVLGIHECLKEVNRLNARGFSHEIIEQINNGLSIMEVLDEQEWWGAEYQFLYLALKKQQSLFYNLVKDIIQSNIVTEIDKSVNVLKVKKTNDMMQQALYSIDTDEFPVSYVHKIARFLWECVFVPIIDGSTKIDINDDDIFQILTVSVKNSTEKSTYMEVFNKLETVVDFLHESLHYKLKDSDCTLLEFMGCDFRDNLSELIIHHCLEYTIPDTKSELESYSIVIKSAQNLQKKLVDAGVFVGDTTSIFDYASNVDELFVNKQSKNFKNTAVSIMKKDLHDMVEVGEVRDLNSSLSEAHFNEFPRCSISKSTNLLLNLLENILLQCLSNTDVCTQKLFKTVEHILSVYPSTVLGHHQKLLQTIPQQIALFYNNCLYIAHRVTEWNEKYSKQVNDCLNITPSAFTTQSHQLQVIASETFTSYIEMQQNQIDEIMKESGLDAIQTADNLNPSVEKCIRQCLRQQELLKTVWHKVLSYEIYNKTFGQLMARLCLHLINSVLQAEDVSSNVAEQLVESYKVVLTRGPKLFIDPKEITLYVNNWYKLNELVFVLGSGLIDICDRWADGKGPLGLHFTAEEVRKLIRALFQNTDRRAAALSKII